MNRDNSKELKIISDEVVDFINTHQERHNVSDEYKDTSVFSDEVLANIKKSSQELFMLGEVNRDYKVSTPDEKQQAKELTEKLYRRAVESLVTEPVDKKKKRIKRPGKIFGKNKGARK